MLVLTKAYSASPQSPLICSEPGCLLVLPFLAPWLYFFCFFLKIIVSSLPDFKESLGKPYLWVEMLLKELLPCYSAVVPSLHGDRVSAERVPGTSFSRNQQPYLASGCT